MSGSQCHISNEGSSVSTVATLWFPAGLHHEVQFRCGVRISHIHYSTYRYEGNLTKQASGFVHDVMFVCDAKVILKPSFAKHVDNASPCNRVKQKSKDYNQVTKKKLR
jgi:hypothetical protein